MSYPNEERDEPGNVFVEGVDYYFENGLLVMTEHYLRERGYCCRNGCRHCPYGYNASQKVDGDVLAPDRFEL
jgi:hypothetical protein